MPPLERLLMGQSGGKLGSFLTPLTPIYLPVHPEKPFYKITNSGILYQILFSFPGQLNRWTTGGNNDDKSETIDIIEWEHRYLYLHVGMVRETGEEWGADDIT